VTVSMPVCWQQGWAGNRQVLESAVSGTSVCCSPWQVALPCHMYLCLVGVSDRVSGTLLLQLFGSSWPYTPCMQGRCEYGQLLLSSASFL
jgi:hypothetical protein